MKRSILAAIMVIAVAAFSTVSDVIIKTKMNDLLESTAALSEKYSSMSEDEAKSSIDSLVSDWKNAEKLLHYFETVDKHQRITELFGMLESDRGEETAAILAETENSIRIYLSARKITFGNLLKVTKELQ